MRRATAENLLRWRETFYCDGDTELMGLNRVLQLRKVAGVRFRTSHLAAVLGLRTIQLRDKKERGAKLMSFAPLRLMDFRFR